MLSLLALLPALALAAPLSKRYSGVYIVSGVDGLCLSLSDIDNAPTDGSLVTSGPCAVASTWDINPGSGSVLLHNYPGFALDAGVNPHDHGGLKVWQSYPGLTQQTWYLTPDNRIAITGGNQCLDEGVNGPQTYQCTTGDNNQVWNIQQGPATGTTSPVGPSSTPSSSPSSSVSASATSSSTGSACTPTATYGATGCIPSGTVYQDTPGNGQRLHPDGRPDLCVSATNGFAGIGTAVEITYCFANDDPFVDLQLWDLPASGSTGAVKLHTSGLCLDAGDNPADGSGVKIYTCYDGLLQQTWTWNDGSTLALANNQCLDTKAGSEGNYPQKPYGYQEVLQTWHCSTNNDPHQIFFTL